MVKPNAFRTHFPALRCVMGDWTYYVTYMKFSDVSHWIRRGDEIHTSKQLSDMIQRALTPRANAISSYLINQQERFFNAIVVGVYGGDPSWQPIEVGQNALEEEAGIDEDAQHSIGILVLGGQERLFAIDGQHRVEAIKKAITQDVSLKDEDLSVIFVAHKTDAEGRKHTRRLFSTLNRYARPVSKGEIVALDEDDAYAIVTRRLVEEFDLLKGFVHFGKTAPLAASDKKSLTSILTVYDITETIGLAGGNDKQIKKQLRPSEQVLDALYTQQVTYWKLLSRSIPEYKELFASKPEDEIAGKYRSGEGGHLLFRPVGQQSFARATRVTMNSGVEMKSAIEALAAVPLKLNTPPWRYVLWNPSTQRINSKVSGLLVEALFLYMVGRNERTGQFKLLDEYRKVLDDPAAELPEPTASPNHRQ